MNKQINEGMWDDFVQKRKDKAETRKVNKENEKLNKEKEIIRNKKINDAAVKFRDYLNKKIEKDGSKWSTIHQALLQKGISEKDSINLIIDLFDSNKKEPSYSEISNLSKNVVKNIEGMGYEGENSNGYDNPRNSYEDNAVVNPKIDAFIAEVQRRYSLPNDVITKLAKSLGWSEWRFGDKDAGEMVDLAIKKSNISPKILKKYETDEYSAENKGEEDINSMLNRHEQEKKMKQKMEAEQAAKAEEAPQESSEIQKKKEQVAQALLKWGFSKDEVKRKASSISAEQWEKHTLQELIKLGLKAS